MHVSRQSLFMAGLLSVIILPGSIPAAEGESEPKQDLTRLIQKIKENERLYQNLKLQLTRTHTDELNLFLVPGKERAQRVAEISLTVEGKQFREQIREQGEFVVISGGLGGPIDPHAQKPEPNRTKTGTEIRTEVSNGHVCRIFNESLFPTEKESREAYGLITDEVPQMPHLARPHMLLNVWPTGVPLSTCLQGPEAVRTFLGETSNKRRYTSRTQVLDSVEYRGHPCTRVRMEILDQDGRARTRREFWLAEDRNLIPVQILSFHNRDSNFQPTAEGVVEDWLEVAPGIWYPQKASFKRYHSTQLRREDQQVLAWRLDYDVQSVELNPEVNASQFTQLDFPPGTSVSVWKNGKQVRKYKQGE